MARWLKQFGAWLEWIGQTIWNMIAGIAAAIAELFGRRPAIAQPLHDNVTPSDVDDALSMARADHSPAPVPSPEAQIDATLDLIWHFVNAPATDRPWIDLEPLSERQRAWLLSLPDEEVNRLAAAGRMATVEAALLGRPFPKDKKRGRKERNRSENTGAGDSSPQALGRDATDLEPKADRVREQIALRVVRGLPIGDIPARKAAGFHQPPALDKTDTLELRFP